MWCSRRDTIRVCHPLNNSVPIEEGTFHSVLSLGPASSTVPAIEIAPIDTGCQFLFWDRLTPANPMSVRRGGYAAPCCELAGNLPLYSTQNDGAGYAESDDNGVSTEDDDDAELQLPVKKKRNITTASYVDVKRWVTGDRAEMPEEDIERELLEVCLVVC